LNLEGESHPDRLRYLDKFNTSFIEYPIKNNTILRHKLTNLEPLYPIDYNSNKISLKENIREF